ncbi:ARM repeat-containing protein [Tilletiaria anomala UBC 951]|uniref:ARM repeat-containing protein n=1 Tax=Tilletiaria anomala (strain ATCC 24038 / CBS 436.72 / UBC 951) TaxID=1037660 RepID=A0A066VFS9_TILAU|nr:ARM repeat-containing protein [Tilletiaria anomala UBC 951]KDN37415.1 ARM repeat-containing protein [Tilletiaria anomala UBC 951]
MEAHIQKALLDRIYERRKAATLDLERQVREALVRGERSKIDTIVQQLCALLLSSSPNNVNARNGGLIGLAGLGIALGQEIAPYLQQVVPPILQCFIDPDSKIRYFACESFYNIAKVCKGEILIFFNEIFDALSKLAADSELSVKNGAELLDRLLKDIVCEAAPHYVSRTQDLSRIRAQQDARNGSISGDAELDVGRQKVAAERFSHLSFGEEALDRAQTDMVANKMFSLAQFIPLLSERIYVLSPFTRNFLVSWITVLDSIPQLELVSFLPAFLDGLLKYLSDPNTDVRVATANVLADFLQKIKDAAEKRERIRQHQRQQIEYAEAQQQQRSAKKEKDAAIDSPGTDGVQVAVQPRTRPNTIIKPVPRRKSANATTKVSLSASPTTGAASDAADSVSTSNAKSLEPSSQASPEDAASSTEPAPTAEADSAASATPDTGAQPEAPAGDQSIVERESAQDDRTSYDDEVEDDEEGTQIFEEPMLEDWVPGHEVRVNYAAILEILLNHISFPDEEIQATALHWISELLLVVPDVIVPFTPRIIPSILPLIAHHSPAIQAAANATNINLYRVIQQLPAPSQPPPSMPPPNRPLSSAAARESKDVKAPVSKMQVPPLSPRIRAQPLAAALEHESGRSSAADSATPKQTSFGSFASSPQPPPVSAFDGVDYPSNIEADLFDYHATVISLTLQLLDEHEETRVTALEWLLMLHQKAPRKILVMDDGTFPALLKTLSDPSEDVIKGDLRLLAQISSASEDTYFYSFMANLLSLFSTDRRLLETRGSLIIRQLCSSLHTERIFRTMAEILEREEDLEFASIMVQNLNIILVTSPELADFRKRLRNLETKDGSTLFSSLYRSWSHNAVATFSLCLLAQAYEHASNLLSIFADLEITVPLLIQIDKLVQLLESPVFTSLRLQLLEPERYPFLFKCLYGLLMLLPQSSAFATLRNRLNAVSSLGFLQTVPRASFPAGSSGTSGPGSASSSSAAGSTRSKMLGREDQIRWNELLLHFRSVQLRHERTRRAAMLASQASDRTFSLSPESAQHAGGASFPDRNGVYPPGPASQTGRRRVTGGGPSRRSSTASPLKSMRVGTLGNDSVPGSVQSHANSFFGFPSGVHSDVMPAETNSRPMSPGVGAGRRGAGAAAAVPAAAMRALPGSRYVSSSAAPGASSVGPR